MKHFKVEKPKHRSPLRLTLGKAYFRGRRRLDWWSSDIKFAKLRPDTFTNQHFAHQTPLLRRLKDVDMFLQHNKIINLGIAIEKVNGVVIYPDETFSYWRLIGKPTRKKGYVDGMLLDKGRVRMGVGGGLCQLSNLIYWMTLHTPLTVTERHRHSFDVFPDSGRSQPFGSGATCFYNYVDLMIKNETDQPFKLSLHMNDTHLVGEWHSTKSPKFCYEIYEKSHTIQSQYWGGYTRHNVIHRRVLDPSGQIHNDQFVTENHAIMMYNPLLSENNLGEDNE
ncbi:MAG: VanW family protein [Defluviitaleaceae bacterium]|nr:VanW family protein [Defluviitaleaceae bacterium]